MFRLYKYLILLFVVFTTLQGRSQNYPVQTFVSITPPYSSYLPDYADPFNNQMKILLTLTDFAVPSHQVKLRFTIEGTGYTIKTKEDLSTLPTITLTPGVPMEVSGSMLAPYLSSDNLQFLQGIDKAQYEATQLLPEGLANVCVEVINAENANQAVLSNPACGQYWFALYDPPLLNLPFCGDEVTPTDPQQIMFSWSPLHMVNPTSAATEYVFEIVEITPANEGIDPNFAFSSIGTRDSIITTNTFVNYGITNLQLQVGYTYYWRVKARDATGRSLFVNNGFSQVCSFKYGNAASSLLNGIVLELESEGTGQNVGTATWNGSSMFDEYVLEVRKTGNPDFNWHPISTTDITEKMYMLDPETEYECRVKGLAGGAETDWSNTSIFTTLPERNYECGSTALPGKPAQIIPLEFLMPGMKVQTGQFIMEVTAAEPATNNQPGHFRGTGRIPITFLMTANVEFEDILIDENLIHYDGRIDVMTSGVEEWAGAFNNVYIDGIISSFAVDSLDSTVVFQIEGMGQQVFDWPPPGETITIIDDSGNIYTIDENGNVTVTVMVAPDNDNLDATANRQIYFIEHPNQVYGFDRLEYSEWTMQYPAIALSDGTNYFVSYKSLRINQTDKLYAVIKSDTLFTPTFVTAGGDELTATMIADTLYEITVGNYATSQVIYAYDDKNGKIGKCNLSVYDDKHNEVVIVPINGAQVPSATVLESSLNEIFIQASATFSVSVAPNYNISFDTNSNGLDGASDSTLSLYSDEMKTIRDAYFADTLKENKLYLFVVPQIEGDLAGYMVRGKIVGFVEEGQPNRTYAHELAHGAFDLEHTFPEIQQGQSNNILDYSNGTHLTHDQWYQIHHFNLSFSFLDDAEDGSLQNFSSILSFYENKPTWTVVQSHHGFVLLDGSTVKIPGVTHVVFDINGKVFMFKANGQNYKPYFAKGLINGGYFITGYYKEEITNSFIKSYPRSDEELAEYKEDSLIGLRFKNFENVVQGDFLYTYAPKIEYDEYSNCICHQIWQADENFNVQSYFSANEDSWFINHQIISRISRSSTVSYQGCNGTCIDYGIFNVSGPAEKLFVQLAPDAPDLFKLEELVQYLNEKIDTIDRFGFYSRLKDESENKYTRELYIDNEISHKGLALFCKKHSVYSKTKFQEIFGTTLLKGGRDVSIIFSKEDLWVMADETYNDISIDHYYFKVTGSKRNYEYSFADLTERDYIKQHHNLMWRGILDAENHGFAQPIALHEYYQQLVAKYGTDNAFIGLIDAMSIISKLYCLDLMELGEAIGNDLQKFLNAAEISPAVYNPSDPNYISGPIIAYRLVNGDIWTDGESSKLQFAYLCGLYNGAVHEIHDMGQLIPLLFGYLCDSEIKKGIDDAIASFSLSTIAEAVEEDFSGNQYERAEMAGRYTVMVITAVIPLSKTKFFTKLKNFTKVLKNLPKKLKSFLKKVNSGDLPKWKIKDGKVDTELQKLTFGDEEITVFSITEDETPVLLIEQNKFLDDYLPNEVVDDLGEVNYKEWGANETKLDELVLVEKSDGTVGVGKKKVLNLDWVDELTGPGWNQVKRDLLKADLKANPNMFDNLDNLDGAEAWKVIKDAIPNASGTTQFAKDPLVIKKVSEMIQEGSDFRIYAGENWESYLNDILSVADISPCSTCGVATGISKSAPSLEVHLENVNYFISNFNASGKASKFFSWMKGSSANGNPLSPYNRSEMFQTLDEIKKMGLTESSLSTVGGKFHTGSSSSRMSDLQVGQVHYEFKNKDFSLAADGSLSKSDIEQVLGNEGAFSSINGISEYKWKPFNARQNVDSDNIKKLWQKAFQNSDSNAGPTTQEIYQNMKSSLKQQLGIDGMTGQQQFNQLILDLDSDLYGFILAN
ncbi:fibronectin type III domain-containing protein [Paracrocinitomix mangrovi]|uniref:fibronectin type III domain-containing protein n=1 Tax=Paracrocinitomix mangrovi TaxID=2862509 RepID=UPI001C8D13A6|nr:fibronectin type III domain-containing protein [Paracrocinitomix mangrovi]UKN01171.1 fibronectin type III domain-containing protein [Paracrocinitomix mangrovi]